MKSFFSYILAAGLGLLIIAPPFDYSIPMMVNSFGWCYLVIASGLLGMFLLSRKINLLLKALSVYLFISCFLSQAPYLSFNAYILVVLSLYGLMAYKACDLKIVFNMLEAAFWLEVILTVFQLAGFDRLLNFDRPEKVFLGTVMQYMRFSSVLAILSPFLIFKSRWYIVPLAIMCALSKSSGLAISLSAGVITYSLLTWPHKRRAIITWFVFFVLAYAVYDSGSWNGAINPKCGGRLISWAYVIKTWLFDLSAAKAGSLISMNGPFRFDWFMFGHGMDTFLPLFPIYKHDLNPFPQAHNDWLQFLWETGIVGFSMISIYALTLVRKLYLAKKYILLAGIACISVNMFFAFPTRMTQTMFLIVVFLSVCEKESEMKNV